MELPNGSRVEDTLRQLQALEAQVRTIPGVKGIFLVAGGGSDREVNKGDVQITIVDLPGRNYSQEQIQAYLRGSLVVEPGVLMNVLDMSSLMGASAMRTQEVQFNIRGPNWAEVQAAAEKTRQYMATNPAFTDLDITYREGKPQTRSRSA